MNESLQQTAQAQRRRILVIEDDPSISLGLRMNLSAEGYEVGVAEDGSSGLSLATDEHWDVIILDVMLPRLNGFEVVKRLRAMGDATPVLMLSAKSAETDKVMGLELGAEDYITKPFGIAEVLARIRVALRRSNGNANGHGNGHGNGNGQSEASADETPVRIGAIEIDRRSRQVTRDGSLVELTATEFDLLNVLASAGGGVLTRKEIFARVWGPDHHGTTRTIDNFVAQLRAKLEEDPASPQVLLTVRGVGYRIAL